jgi:DNA-binding MarR family transcriptional regulator
MRTQGDAEGRAMNALRRLVSALRTSGAGAETGGLSVAQQFALRVIGRQSGLAMGDLASATVTTPSTVSEVVVRLVDRGLVRRRRDTADERRVRLELTADGAALFERVELTVPEKLVHALESMDPMSVEVLAESLETWVKSAGLDDEIPRMFGEPGRRPNASSRAARFTRAQRSRRGT